MAYIPPLNGGRLNASIGGNSTSAGAGYALMSTGTMLLAGGNNVTLSQNGNAVTISAGSGGGGVAVAGGGATYTSGTANFSAAGGALTISSAGGQALNFSVPATSSLSATGAISISTNGSTISIGAPVFDFSIGSNTAGVGGSVSNGLLLAGGNNITLSQSTDSNGASVTVNGGTGGGGGIAFANSNTTFSTGTVNLVEGGGAITIASTTGQSFNISVPATSSFSATGALSISRNGSTVSIGAPLNGTVSNWEPAVLQHVTLTNATLASNYAPASFFKLQPMAYVNASQLAQLLSINFSTNTSIGGTVTLGAGIYTANGSTLSLITQSSGTISYSLANSSTSSTASFMGIRALSLPLNAVMSPGNYWIGMWSRTSANIASLSIYNMLVANNSALTYSGSFGQAVNATAGIQEGVGLFATSTSALPTSAAMSQITQSGFVTNMMPYIAFKNKTW